MAETLGMFEQAVLLAIVLTAVIGFLSTAAEASEKVKTTKLGTDFSFDDQLVGGRYHYPDEAVATVEDEKVLNDLLSARKNFKDRLQTQESAGATSMTIGQE